MLQICCMWERVNSLLSICPYNHSLKLEGGYRGQRRGSDLASTANTESDDEDIMTRQSKRKSK